MTDILGEPKVERSSLLRPLRDLESFEQAHLLVTNKPSTVQELLSILCTALDEGRRVRLLFLETKGISIIPRYSYYEVPKESIIESPMVCVGRLLTIYEKGINTYLTEPELKADTFYHNLGIYVSKNFESPDRVTL